MNERASHGGYESTPVGVSERGGAPRFRDRWLRHGGIAAMLSLLAGATGCSQLLDFQGLRFHDDAAESTVDAGAPDAAEASAPDVPFTIDDVVEAEAGPMDVPAMDVPAMDVPAMDVPAMDVPAMDVPPMDLGPSDLGMADLGPRDVPRLDVGIDVPRDVPPPPMRSCADHLRAGRITSGIYLIDPDGDPATPQVSVYCDQVRDGGGWQRVVNIADGQGCPTVLAVDAVHRLCVRRPGPADTVSVFRAPIEGPYSQVRGRAALQGHGDLDAFDNPMAALAPEAAFTDGLTLYRAVVDDGGAPQHVFTWTVTESLPAPRETGACPCAGGRAPLPLVGDRYLCAPLLDRRSDAGPVDPTVWRLPELPWQRPAAPCTAGDPAGWFRTDLGAMVRGALELRLTVSGSLAAGGTEDLGIATLEVYVR